MGLALSILLNTQYPQPNSPHWYSYISLEISWEGLITDQSIFSLVIIWLILVTISLDNVWILLKENWWLSLLGLTGLSTVPNVKNKDNELWKTVRLTSLQKPTILIHFLKSYSSLHIYAYFFVSPVLLILLLKFCKIIFMFHSVKMVAVPMARNFIKFVTQLL